MSATYNLASAGCLDFVRPMEKLMQVIYERLAHINHIDAWTINYPEFVSGMNGSTYRSVETEYGFPAGVAHVWPNGQAEVQNGAGQNSGGSYYNWQARPPLWRSTTNGLPVNGTLRRWDRWEDLDRGLPFGYSHDERLGVFSDILHAIHRRFVTNASATGLTEAELDFLSQAQVPKLGPPPTPSYMTMEAQLTTVDHFNEPGETFTLSETGHRLAMPFAGHGLLSMVRIGVDSDLAGAQGEAKWLAALPDDSASPYVPAGDGLRLQVCADNGGVPGEVLPDATAVRLNPAVRTSEATGASCFFLHRPVELEHTKTYWLVLSVPVTLDPGEIRPMVISLSESSTDEKGHNDTAYQLKTWNGTAWENHAQPSLCFSLHTPKFAWRSKQLWNRVEQLRNQLHFRAAFHVSHAEVGYGGGFRTEIDGGVAAIRAGVLAELADRVAYNGVFDFDMTDPAQYAQSIRTSYELYGGNGGGNGGFGNFPYSNYEEQEQTDDNYYRGRCSFAQLGWSNYKLWERKLPAWRPNLYRCAKLEFRTGIRTASVQSAVGVFAVDEVLTMKGGLAASVALLKVTAVDENGRVTACAVVEPGRYMKLISPQRGYLEQWAEGERSIAFVLLMQVTELLVVDGGKGYISDAPVQIAGGIGYQEGSFHGRFRARRTGDAISRVDILDPGAGYYDGGSATTVERLELPDTSSDPAVREIWPGVTYCIRGTRQPGYALELGELTTTLPILNYNGVDYSQGDSFTGQSGVTEFTPNEGIWNSYWTASYFVSGGIDAWCHRHLGWARGSKRVNWPGSGKFLMKAAAFGSKYTNQGNDWTNTPGVAKTGPDAFPLVSDAYQEMGSVNNNQDFDGPTIGPAVGFDRPAPSDNTGTFGTYVFDGLIYFTQPDWEHELLG